MAKTETAPPTVDDDPKLQVFNVVVKQLTRLSRAEQYAVLHAAAKYFESSIKLEG